MKLLKIFITMSIFLACCADIAIAKTGSVCIASVVAPDRFVAVHLGNYDFTVSFDGGKPLAVPHNAPVLVSKLSLASRHSIRIRQEGKPAASFTFRFYEDKRLCLWLNEFYGTWQLDSPGNRSWCRCARQSAA